MVEARGGCGAGSNNLTLNRDYVHLIVLYFFVLFECGTGKEQWQAYLVESDVELGGVMERVLWINSIAFPSVRYLR